MEASAPTDPSNVETDIEFVSWTQKLIGILRLDLI